jgi:hypothetical protein
MTASELIRIYKEVDPYEKQPVSVHIAPETPDQRELIRNEAAYNLTKEFLKNFKRETEGLTPEELRDYIEGMTLQDPKPANGHKPYFNSAIFRAQRNFFIFIQELKKTLETPAPEPKFQVNSIALACLAMTRAGMKPELDKDQADKVSLKFGYKSKTSGQDLKNRYNNLRDKVNLYPSRPEKWKGIIQEAETILDKYPSAKEALKSIKQEIQERRHF